MRAASRTAVRSAQHARVQATRQQRRFDSHGSHSTTENSPPAPRNESFGSGFFIGLLCIPAAIGVYSYSKPSEDGKQPGFSQYISDSIKSLTEQDTVRNTLHTDAIERAAVDRSLFQDDPGQRVKHFELAFPEQFNAGAPPINAPAGHSTANIEKVIEKYRERAYAANERKLEQLRTNTVPSEQPLQPTTNLTPGT